MKFKIGDKVKLTNEEDIFLVIFDYDDGDYKVVNIETGRICIANKDEITLIEESSNNESHKGCDFVNGDFYRSFSKKNGSVVFNKVKVSTLCICRQHDCNNEQIICVATVNSDERLKIGTKVKLNDNTEATVSSCIKIMDKYINDLILGLTNGERGADEVLYKIIGVYKEKEVTKTITETELVLEEI